MVDQTNDASMGHDVPDEVLEAQALAHQKLADKVNAFGEALAKKREEAIAARLGSGIEDDWNADEEAYQGIDDANRDTAYKPGSPNGSFQPTRKSAIASRSTVFLNITRPYVDAAAARVSDMLLPNDETNWDIRPSPISEMVSPQNPVAQAAGMVSQPPQAPLQPVMGMAQPGMGMPPAGASPVAAAPQPTPVAPAQPVAHAAPAQQGNAIYQDQPDPMQAVKDQADAACKGAKRQIEDWLVDCQYHAELRKQIEDAARLGTGILKGPTPGRKMSRAAKIVNAQVTIVMEQKIVPGSKRINPWDFYPDGACGEDIHEGGYVWERDQITARQLRELKDVPGYLHDQIDTVLEQGPNFKKSENNVRAQKIKVDDKEKFEVWYFYGMADREDLEAAGIKLPESGDVSVPAIVTMVNETVIKAALNPLDSGEFPYDVMVWQRRSGIPWGMGIARQVNTPQRMLNAATRNMMDNAAFTSGPQIILRKKGIEPADGVWAITPRKLWYVTDGADVEDVKNAFITVNIPTQQEALNAIIQFALKMAEDVTGLPMLMQGSQGNAPDTVGGMTIVNNNANVVLRRIIRTFDDRVTEPHIRRYYEYLLMHGEDDSIKGDFQIDARGSTSLIERDFQNNEAPEILKLSLTPAYKISPAKAMTEYLKSRRFDSKRFEMSDEEKKEQQAQQPPPAPAVQAAQIRVDADMKKTQMVIASDEKQANMQAETELKVAQMERDRDAEFVRAEEQKNELAHQAQIAELRMKWELAQLTYANQHSMKLEDVKAQLAQTAAKLNLQRELAHLDSHTKQVLAPPVEPQGRAPAGQAFAL